MVAVGRDQLLITSQPPLDECENVEIEDMGFGAVMRKIKDSSAVYSFDGHSLTKLFCMAKPGDEFSPSAFTRSGKDLLMLLLMPKHTLYRYSDGQIQKIATIDYGDMEMPEASIKIESQGPRLLL